MNFIERVASRVFMLIFDKAWEMVNDKISARLNVTEIIKRHDGVRDDLVKDLAKANTTEEIDEILDRMVDYKPDV